MTVHLTNSGYSYYLEQERLVKRIQDALTREQIARALYDHEFQGGDCEFPAWDHESVRETLRERFRRRADAILALVAEERTDE